MLKHFRDEFPELLTELKEDGDLTDDLAERLSKAIANFKSHYTPDGEA